MPKSEEPPLAMHRAPRCGAKCKRTGLPCRMPAMANGRCFLHGGKSTGARTEAGMERCRKVNVKHGFYSQESMARRREIRRFISESKKLLRQIESKALQSGNLDDNPIEPPFFKNKT